MRGPDYVLEKAQNRYRYDQPDPTLTLAEATALAALDLTCGTYLRTEQERIPISDAGHSLAEALDLVQPHVGALSIDHRQ